MAAPDFQQLSVRLVAHVKVLIRSGELTERGLARLMGYSQPHVHNVLAGVRGMNIRFADDLLSALGVSLEELTTQKKEEQRPLDHVRVALCAGELSPSRGFPKEAAPTSSIYVPAQAVADAAGALAIRVGEDEYSMWPLIWPRDIVVINASPDCRIQPNIDGIYVLRISGRGQLRRCRRVGSRLLTISDYESDTENSPTWIGLDRKNIFDVVRGQVVWVSRCLEPKAA